MKQPCPIFKPLPATVAEKPSHLVQPLKPSGRRGGRFKAPVRHHTSKIARGTHFASLSGIVVDDRKKKKNTQKHKDPFHLLPHLKNTNKEPKAKQINISGA